MQPLWAARLFVQLQSCRLACPAVAAPAHASALSGFAAVMPMASALHCWNPEVAVRRCQILLLWRVGIAGWRVMALAADADVFVLCAQCSILTYPHSRCRCVLCGIIHVHGKGCRRMVACSQCGQTAAPHASCTCNRCGQLHSRNRGCRIRAVPVVYAAALMRPDHVQPHSIGSCDIVCPHCAARTWPGESISCCARGALVLPVFPAAPADFAALMYSSHVQQHIRQYNTALGMASVGHKSKGLNWGAFILGGKTYHRIGSLLPDVNNPHCFAQIYMLDVSAATDRRLGIYGGDAGGLKRDVLAKLHDHMLALNPLVQQFVAVARSDVPHMVWKCSDDISTMQMGALVAQVGSRRDIVVQRVQGPLMRISDGHGLYHPLAYPLLFPLGTAGWNENMVVVDSEGIWRIVSQLLSWPVIVM